MIKLVLAKDIDFKNWKIQFFTALNQVVFPMYQKIILEIGFECKNLLNFICNTMKFNPILPEGGGAVMAPTYLLNPLGKRGSKWGDFHWAMGVFNHEKGAIWQSHLAAQKEGVVTAIIFSNHKTS